VDPDKTCRPFLQRIKTNFDLTIVERPLRASDFIVAGVMDFNLLTLFFSTTPYRNDYKSFQMRGRYVFNCPHANAVEAGGGLAPTC
jgi:hypothetical protein